MMTVEEAKEFVNTKYAKLTEMSKDLPEWTRVKKVNYLIKQLREEYGFILTTPTGHPIVSVIEDAEGLIYNVTGMV